MLKVGEKSKALLENLEQYNRANTLADALGGEAVFEDINKNKGGMKRRLKYLTKCLEK